MNFIGRKSKLAALEKEYKSGFTNRLLDLNVSNDELVLIDEDNIIR